MSTSCFNQLGTRLVFDASYLSLPYKMRDPIALQFARQECAEALDSLAKTHRTVIPRARDAQREARMPAVGGAGGSRAAHVAAHAQAHARRRGHVVLAPRPREERRERAMLLLRSRTLSIKDVARSVGYSNVMNFTRAVPPLDRHDAGRASSKDLFRARRLSPRPRRPRRAGIHRKTARREDRIWNQSLGFPASGTTQTHLVRPR